MRESDPGVRLAEAQVALAREFGFPSWRKLKAHVEQLTATNATDEVVAPQQQEQLVAAFFARIGAGETAIVRLALDHQPWLVNAVGPHPHWGGRPQPLHLAIEGKRRDLFDLLLERGADVNGQNDGYDHWSPLMLAINRGQNDMRDELTRRGARVGLLEALMLKDDNRVGDLLRGDGLPAIAPNAGSILAFARTPFAIDRLLELGASATIADRWGSTPIEAMSRLGPAGRDLVRYLESKGAIASPAEYARLGDREQLAKLIVKDPSVLQLDAVVMGAVDFRHHSLVRWLLDQGANVNARSSAQSRHTALHSAAWNGDMEMVKLLVEAGADITARDEQYDGDPAGWAETAVEVANNPASAEVGAYLRALEESRGSGP
jgi:ankyrin repeat protein